MLKIENYELIYSALEKEMNYKNNPDYFYNLQSLINTLSKLDHSRTVDDIYKYFNEHKERFIRLRPIINLLVAFTEEKNKFRIFEFIKDEKQEIRQYFINALIGTDSLDDDYLRVIVENLSDNELISFLHLIDLYKNTINISKLEEFLLNRKPANILLNNIIYVSVFQKVSEKTKALLCINYLNTRKNFSEVEYGFYNSVKFYG
jgi:hypothetical protein